MGQLEVMLCVLILLDNAAKVIGSILCRDQLAKGHRSLIVKCSLESGIVNLSE